VVGYQACAVAHADPVPSPDAPTDGADHAPGRIEGAGAGGPGASPWINIRPPRVTAGLTAEAVQRALRRNHAQLTECYTHALAADPRAHGTATARLQVIAGGVAQVERSRTAPRNPELESCVQEVLGRIEWPNPRGAPATEVDLTIDMAPAPPLPPGRRAAR
jgi:hypothetical protein